MKMRSFFILFAAGVIFVGGGCGRLEDRYGLNETKKENPEPVVREKIAEIPSQTPVASAHKIGEVYLYPAWNAKLDGETQNLYESIGGGEKRMITDVPKNLGVSFWLSPIVIDDIEIKNKNFVFFKTMCECDAPGQLFAYDLKKHAFVKEGVAAQVLFPEQTLWHNFFSPDGKYLAHFDDTTVREGGLLTILNLETLEVSHAIHLDPPFSFFNTVVEFDNSGNIDQKVTKWKSPTEFNVAVYKGEVPDFQKPPLKIDHEIVINVSKIGIESDSKKEISYWFDSLTDTLFAQRSEGFGVAVSHNVPERLRTLQDNNYFISPKGKYIAVFGSKDVHESIEIYDLNSFELLKTYEVPERMTAYEKVSDKGYPLPGSGTKWQDDETFMPGLFSGEPKKVARKPVKIPLISVK